MVSRLDVLPRTELRVNGASLAGSTPMEAEKYEENEETDAEEQGRGEGHQDNLAEGERDIIEESIRIHEKKGDLGGKKPVSAKGR